MAPTIREARLDDLDALLPLLAQLNPDDPPTDREEAREVWERSLGDRHPVWIVAESDGALVGACCVVLVPNLTRGLRPFGVVENVIVDEKCRRRGIASRLLARAREMAESAGCYKLVLMSNRKRTEAHPLYRKAGFESDSKLAFDLRL